MDKKQTKQLIDLIDQGVLEVHLKGGIFYEKLPGFAIVTGYHLDRNHAIWIETKNHGEYKATDIPANWVFVHKYPLHHSMFNVDGGINVKVHNIGFNIVTIDQAYNPASMVPGSIFADSNGSIYVLYKKGMYNELYRRLVDSNTITFQCITDADPKSPLTGFFLKSADSYFLLTLKEMIECQITPITII